ncbi:MAG: DUF5718 family protein [Planctomycetota bacterium]
MTIDLRTVLGLGVAGNFTGHLEQAGEASDFADLAVPTGRPKGIFPFYIPPAARAAAEVPGHHFLHIFPLSRDTIEHPGTIAGHSAKLQIEPEIALRCELDYVDHPASPGRCRVAAVRPTHFTAYNDCSTRRPDATKISEKKNWGPRTKGLADDQWMAIDRFAPGGVLDRFRLACYLRRDAQLLSYGEDSPVAGPGGYATMYTPLLDWLAEQLNGQRDVGPLENLSQWLHAAGYPRHAVVSIGATRYTDLGETTFLQPGDESIVIAYDQTVHRPESVPQLISTQADREHAGRSLAVLRQCVVART